MGIEVPDLDDQEFEEIFEKARRKIPIYTEEWTDHNVHDTGIAILELFAWVSETHIYQINHISDEERRKYLKLLGLSRQPPKSATARLAVDVPAGAGGKIIPGGTQVVADDQSGDLQTFETETATTVTEANIAGVTAQAGEDRVNNTRENNTQNTHFYPFGDRPDQNDTLYLGFDGDPFVNSDVLELDVDLYDETLPEMATHGDYESPFEPSVELRWEHCVDYENWRDDEAWAEMPVKLDETNCFYEEGTVVLKKPAGWDLGYNDPIGIHSQPPGLDWIRCQIKEPGYEIPPQLNAIRLNVLNITHIQTIKNNILHREDGGLEATIESNQEFFFNKAPVLDATITVDGKQWTQVSDFDSSGPTDRHYMLDQEDGVITFGDGEKGAKPPVGTHVRAEQYVHGGGPDGNVSNTADWYFADDEAELVDDVPFEDVEITPVESATGGESMETVDQALNRFKRHLKMPQRATTLESFEFIATHTPGLRFGRAKATTMTRETPRGNEFNEINVFIVPYSTLPKPEPSEGFLEATETHLQRCVLLGDQVTVQEPYYVNIEISLTVSALPSYSESELNRAVIEQLSEYVHPIIGFDGDGWPFGRPLYVTEIEDIVSTLAGVKSVKEISFTASGEETIDEYGNVLIAETALLSVSERDIDVTVQFGPNDRSINR